MGKELFENIKTGETEYIFHWHDERDAEDLKKFASEVNSGNSFAGKTVYLMADIDLKCDENNQWVPAEIVEENGVIKAKKKRAKKSEREVV